MALAVPNMTPCLSVLAVPGVVGVEPLNPKPSFTGNTFGADSAILGEVMDGSAKLYFSGFWVDFWKEARESTSVSLFLIGTQIQEPKFQQQVDQVQSQP
jgi:hypothetical protein